METLKVRFIGSDDSFLCLEHGKVYERQLFDETSYFWRVVDDSGEDYLYPKGMFEVVEDD